MTQPPAPVSTEDRLAAVLSHIQAMETALRSLQHDLVHLINGLGVTWDQIGEAHDPPISRQAASKRYSHPKPRRRR